MRARGGAILVRASFNVHERHVRARLRRYACSRRTVYVRARDDFDAHHEDNILWASYLGYIGIESGNFGTSNTIVLYVGLYLAKYDKLKINIYIVCPRLHRIWDPNTMESRAIVFAVFDLTCRCLPLKVRRSYHPA